MAKIGERGSRRLAKLRLVRIRVLIFGGRGIRVLLLHGRDGGERFGFIGVEFRVGGVDVVTVLSICADCKEIESAMDYSEKNLRPRKRRCWDYY